MSASEDDALKLKKSQLLVQKGVKAEERGELEEAVSIYEEAYQTYPKNILPLLRWSKILVRIGMYERASVLLKEIPVEKLPEAGRSEVYMLHGKIAVARKSVEEAASAYSFALKASEKNTSARIRLAMVNLLLGMHSRSEELLHDYENFSGLPRQDLVLAYFVDLYNGNVGRAFQTAGDISALTSRSRFEDSNVPAMKSLWDMQITNFLATLPLAMGNLTGLVYFIAIFAGLIFVAGRFSAPTAVWHSIVFLAGAVVLIMGCQFYIRKELFLAAMQDDFSLYDSIWIIPRLLIAGHLIALAQFVVFPCFKLLPEELRPRRYEFFGIWFFCWFFMIFVLVFQSRMDLVPRLAFMAGSLLLVSLSSFFMPLGRFVLFKISNALGFSGIAEVRRQDLASGKGIGFTDAKILETKAWKLIESEEFEEVVLTSRKVLGSLDRKNFPQLWKALILALISREDLVEAQKCIADFLENFKNTSSYESGLLYEALLKCRKGDFAGALKIIRALPDDRVKSFSPDENAISLLILGRCSIAYKEFVQAHIDLTKAFNCARLPLLKSDALVEIAELDFNMNSKDALAKWKLKSAEINGGQKSMANIQVILSIIAQSEGKTKDALKLASSACCGKITNSRACAWYGHLLCLADQHNDAEALLSRMAPDSVDATRLMTEVTESGA